MKDPTTEQEGEDEHQTNGKPHGSSSATPLLPPEGNARPQQEEETQVEAERQSVSRSSSLESHGGPEEHSEKNEAMDIGAVESTLESIEDLGSESDGSEEDTHSSSATLLARPVQGGESSQGVVCERDGLPKIAINISGNNAGEVTAFRMEKITNIISENDSLQSIAARTNMNIESASPQGYIQTAGYRRAWGFLENQGSCMITGTLGSGRTTMAHHLLLALRAKEYLSLELLTPMDCQSVPWQKVGDRFRLALFVDNVLGAGSFDDELWKAWGKQLDHMRPYMERGHVKVILVSRSNVYAHIKEMKASRGVLYQAPEVALAGENCQLSDTEKDQILELTLTFYKAKLPEQISKEVLVEASKMSLDIGFPQVCVYLATNEKALKDPVAFFKHPIQFLQSEFHKLKMEDVMSFYVLSLVLFQVGELSERFVKAETSRSFLSEVADLVGLPMTPGSGKILEVAEHLCGTFLKWNPSRRSFSFSHQSTWDLLFTQFCRSDLEKVLKVCLWRQVVIYVRTDGNSKADEDFVYQLPEEDWPLLATRFLHELLEGDSDQACSHPCLQHPDFTFKFWARFLSDKDIRAILETQHPTKTIHTSCSRIRDLSKSHPSTPSTQNAIPYDQSVEILSYKTPLSSLILRKCTSVVKHIVSHPQFSSLPMSTQSQLLKEGLACACYAADSDLVAFLLDLGAVPSEECIRAVCCAEHEDLGLVEKILQWNSQTTSVVPCPTKTTIKQKLSHLLKKKPTKGRESEVALLPAELLLQMVRVAGQQDRPNTLHLILSQLPETDSTKAELSEILGELVLLSHPTNQNHSLGKKLYQTGQVFNTLTKAGAEFRVHIDPFTAAGHREPNALREWLEHGLDIFTKDQSRFTLLHHAAMNGAHCCLQLLLECIDSPEQCVQFINATNKCHQTALSLAAKGGHMAILGLLLQHGAIVKESSALLHLASCQQWHMDAFMTPTRDDEVPSSSCCLGSQNASSHTWVKEILRTLVAEKDDVRVSETRSYSIDGGVTPFHTACMNKHSLLVDVFLEMEEDPDIRSDRGRTPLHVAAWSGHVDVLQQLSTRVDLHAREFSKCQTALHLAARRGHLSAVEMLVNKGVAINAQDVSRRTPLHLASLSGHTQVVEYLLQKGAAVDLADDNGMQAIHAAASGSHLKVMQCLLKGGASANASDLEGKTPIHHAASRGWCSAVEFLMFQEADACATDLDGNTVLHSLAASKELAHANQETPNVPFLVRRLAHLAERKNKSLNTPVMLAAQAGNVAVLNELLKLHHDISATNNTGDTLLHMAAKQQEEQVLLTLVPRCLKLMNVRNSSGDSPLVIAARAGNIFALKELLKHPCDTTIRGQGGNSVFHELVDAIQLKDIEGDEAAKQLLETLVTQTPELISCPNDAGDRPISSAIRKGKWFWLSLFLKFQCDLKGSDKSGNTLLHCLAESIPPKPLVARLRALTADLAELVDRANVEGSTPVMVASSRGNAVVVRMLLKLHCDLSRTNGSGANAVFLAISNGHFDVAEMLVRENVDVSVRTRDGTSLLHALASCKDLDHKCIEKEAVRSLVKKLAEKCSSVVNCTNSKGETPLFLAAQSWNMAMLEELLKQEVDFAILTKDGMSILHALAGCPDLVYRMLEADTIKKLVESLVQKCSSLVTCPNSKGETPLYLAAQAGNADVIAELLNHEIDITVQTKEGNTLLHSLAISRAFHLEQFYSTEAIQTLTCLIEKCSSLVDCQNSKGETPLLCAMHQENQPIIEGLLKQGADVTRCTKDGTSLLHVLAAWKDLDNECEENETMRANVELVVGKCRSFINSPNGDGKTPLYLAFCHGNFFVADLLLEQNGMSDMQDEESKQPQEAKGSSPDGKRTSSPLHGLAASASLSHKLKHDEALHEKIAHWIKTFSHCINQQDSEGDTPLLKSLKERNLRVAEQLLQYKPDLSITDASGGTVLHALAQAAWKGGYAWVPSRADQLFLIMLEDQAQASGIGPMSSALDGTTALDVVMEGSCGWEGFLRSHWWPW